MAVQVVLLETETTSETFTVDSYFDGNILLYGTVAGTWRLEILASDGTWVDVANPNLPMNSEGAWRFVGYPGVNYRLTGGSAGAKAELIGR